MSCSFALEARDDVQWWQWLSLNVYKESPHTLLLHMENHLYEDIKEEGLWLIALRYSYAAHKQLSLGLNYTYLDSHNIAKNTWTHHQRLELEANPHFELGKRLSFQNRNRFELRYIEDNPGEDYRTRHRFQFSTPFTGRIKKAYLSSELFYSYEKNKLDEIRTLPCGLGFAINKSLSVNLFYLIQSKLSATNDQWTHRHVLGTQLNF